MNNKTELQKVSEETMRFMRGKYVLDEVAGKYYDIDCLKFRQGKRTILSINIHKDLYDFQVIFGKSEREKFEARRSEFPKMIQDIYDSSQTHYDGKWMLIPVSDLERLEAVKSLVLIKKNPNRKPFPKDRAIYSDCGMRCDLCVHYVDENSDEAFRKKLHKHVCNVYVWNPDDTIPPCMGCEKGGISGKFDCDQIKCAKEKGFARCSYCAEYPCDKATAGYPPVIKWRSLSAEDVTWAILPYVDGQYGN